LALAEDAKDPDAIIELARRINAVDPYDAAAWTARIEARIQTEDYGRALAALDAWQREGRGPLGTIDGYRGDIYLAQELPDNAEQAWRKAIALSPKDYVVLSKLADLLESEDRPAADILALRAQAAAAKPTAALIAARGGARLGMHQWDEANADIQQANQLDATDATVQKWLPLVQGLTPYFSQLKSLDRSFASKPKDPGPLLEQAGIFTETGLPQYALVNARRALELDPASIRARILAGEAEIQLARPLDAAKYKVSHDLKVGDGGFLTPQTLGELARCDADVERNPGKAGPLAVRSKTLRGLNQYVLALDDASAALRLNPNFGQAEFEMASDLNGLGRAGEALPHMVRATDLSPNDSDAWYMRGIIEAERADYTAAVASQSQSLALRETSYALKARVDCELRLGLAAQAATDQQRLHQIDPSE
jgi:tetratricopeptide (TPR) repeat protein